MENNHKLKPELTIKNWNDTIFLPVSSNQEWFDALIKNDVDLAKSILAPLSEKDRHILLNSHFHYEAAMDNKLPKKVRCSYLPLHLAVAFNARRIVELMLTDYKVDVKVVDLYKCNILHACVIGAYYCNDLEPKICDTVNWLLDFIEESDIEKLFAQENKDGYRPIEFASQQSCVLLMQTFLQSKAFVKKTKGYGVAENRYHDVTEYETGSRALFSPISTLAYIHEKRLQSEAVCDVIMSPLFLAWIDAKLKSNSILLVLWVFMRYGMLALYLFADNDAGWFYDLALNQTQIDTALCPDLAYINTGSSRYIRLILLLIVISYFGISILLDIVEAICNYTRTKQSDKIKDICGKKTLVINTNFYAVNHFVLCVIITINAGFYLHIHLKGLITDPSLELLIVLFRALIPILILWSFNYFIQMIPYGGPSFISIQAMQADVLKFLVMFILICVPFALGFQSFLLFNSKTGCVDDFGSIFKTTYSLFLIMLNDYDLTSLDVRNVLVLRLLHVTYTFMIGIMLLNFLIAMMSSKAAAIKANEQIIYKLNQLAVVNKLESRLKLLTAAGYHHFVKMGFHCEDGRVYLVSEEFRLKKLLDEQLPS